MNTLVVTNPFGGHEKGDRITDPQEIARILAGEHAHHIVPANHEDAPVIPAIEPVILADAPELSETTTEEA